MAHDLELARPGVGRGRQVHLVPARAADLVRRVPAPRDRPLTVRRGVALRQLVDQLAVLLAGRLVVQEVVRQAGRWTDAERAHPETDVAHLVLIGGRRQAAVNRPNARLSTGGPVQPMGAANALVAHRCAAMTAFPAAATRR